MDSFIGFLFALVVAAVVLLIVDKFNVGLAVGGFVNAVVAALAIAVVGALVMFFLGLFNITIGGGLLGAIVFLIVAAVVLLLAAKIIPGFVVSGFGGAVISAIAIGFVYWLVGWVVSLF
jgi:putative membrane protein